MVSLAHRASAEVSIGEEERSHEGPDIEEEADSAGAENKFSWSILNIFNNSV